MLRTLKKVFYLTPFLSIISIIFSIITAYISIININIYKNFLNELQNINGNILKTIIRFFIIQIIVRVCSNFNIYFSEKFNIVLNNKLDLEFLNKCKCFNLENFEDINTYKLINEAESLGKSNIINIYTGIMNVFRDILAIILAVTSVERLDPIILLLFIFPTIKYISKKKLYKNILYIDKENVEISRRATYLKYVVTNIVSIKEVITYNYFDNIFKVIGQCQIFCVNPN